jgi:uncharacterized protein (DUF1330 family)
MLEAILLVLIIGMLLAGWQLFRYQRTRHNHAQDQQRILHSADVFHVILFFRLQRGDKLIETAARCQQKLMTKGNVRLIYAGQTAYTVGSKQLGAGDWDGVLMFEYSNRAEYEEQSAAGDILEAREYFSDSYLHAMRRSCKSNISIPLLLLRLRLKELLLGHWRLEPFQASTAFETFPEYQVWRSRQARLWALNKVNGDGLVIYNLNKRGTSQQRAAYAAYGRQMSVRMAALGHGPLHVGRSVALEGRARFDQVIVIHYPSASYYADLLSSQFYQNILGKRQLSDSLSVVTIPVTHRL